MKNILFIFLFTGLCGETSSQVVTMEEAKSGIQIGLDIFKNIPPMVLGRDYFIQDAIIVEPSIRVNYVPERYWLIHLGVMKASTVNNFEREQIAFQEIRGVYIKPGWERNFEQSKSMVVGFNALLSWASFKGRYQFDGPVFGDYQGAFKENNNFALGAEMYLAYDWHLSGRWMIRSLGRMTLAGRKGEIRPYYFPGVGYTKDRVGVLFSLGATFQIYYKVR